MCRKNDCRGEVEKKEDEKYEYRKSALLGRRELLCMWGYFLRQWVDIWAKFWCSQDSIFGVI